MKTSKRTENDEGTSVKVSSLPTKVSHARGTTTSNPFVHLIGFTYETLTFEKYEASLQRNGYVAVEVLQQ